MALVVEGEWDFGNEDALGNAIVNGTIGVLTEDGIALDAATTVLKNVDGVLHIGYSCGLRDTLPEPKRSIRGLMLDRELLIPLMSVISELYFYCGLCACCGGTKKE